MEILILGLLLLLGVILILIEILFIPGTTIFGILGGSIVDKKGRKVLSYGDIVRTNDMKIFSKAFKINKSLSIVRVVK